MIRRINLLPEELRVANKRTFYLIASLSVVSCISILYFINQVQKGDIVMLQAKRDSLRKEMASLAGQNAKYKEIVDKINLTESRKKDMEAKVGVVKTISEGRVLWSDPLYELSNIVPAGLWLSSLSSSDVMAGDKKVKGIRVSGMAFSSSRITDFMAALGASPHFEGVSLLFVQNAESRGREVFSFEITFRIRGKK